MKYKLLPTWRHLRKLSYKVENLFRKIERAGSPPAGVAGTRIARAFRSEFDKKSKDMIAEERKKIEKKYEREKKQKLETALKGIRKSYDGKIAFKQYQIDHTLWTHHARLFVLKKELEALKNEKELRLKDEPEHFSKKFDQVFKVKIDAEVEQFKRKLAPQGFHFRLKFAIDTYGGKAYAGSMVMARDREGRGKWEKMGSMTAPKKK